MGLDSKLNWKENIKSVLKKWTRECIPCHPRPQKKKKKKNRLTLTTHIQLLFIFVLLRGQQKPHTAELQVRRSGREWVACPSAPTRKDRRDRQPSPEQQCEARSKLGECLFAKRTSDSSTNYNSFLNWTFTLPNILHTAWWAMIHFLIELLVRRTWFGQFNELYFVLNWLVMRCKLWPKLAEDQQTAWSKM